jgi:short-subunit dehydrogenase
MPLDGKRVVLTGGAGGIGSLVARELRLAKAELLIVDRVAPRNKTSRFLQGDLATMPGIETVARALADEGPDVLVNLAGVQHLGPLERESADHVLLSYMVNLVAPVLLTRAVLPGMKSRGAGQIVNIGSVLGSINYPYFVTYSSAKAGLRGFSEGLRRELHGTGVDVTYIAPRAVKTGLSNASVREFAELARMTLDDPEMAVRHIFRAIVRRRKNVMIGIPERLFAQVNALVPQLVDAAIAIQTARAKTLFAQ